MELKKKSRRQDRKYQNPFDDMSASFCAQSTIYLLTKRILDSVSALCLLVVTIPAFLLVAIAIKLDSRGPVFFRHKRIGQHGKTIYLWKFRSMIANAESLIAQFTPEQKKVWETNYKLDDDPRTTRIGRFLRKSSLDELPQLFNIISGNLSMVGPRPVVANEIRKYALYQDKFLSAKPGLTGYWQAYARGNVDYDTRMQMELYYIDHASMQFDLIIMFHTIHAVIHKTGAR